MIENIGRERDKPFSKNLNTPVSNLDTYDPVLRVRATFGDRNQSRMAIASNSYCPG